MVRSANKTKVAYFSQSVLLSQSANSIHVMNMIFHLSKFVGFTFFVAHWSSKDSRQLEKKLKHFYGFSPETTFVRRIVRGFPFARELDVLRIVVLLKFRRVDYVVSRDLIGALVSACFGMNVVFEAHHPLSETSRLQQLVFKLLARMSRFRGLVVITRALENHFLECYPSEKLRTIVLPDGANPVHPSNRQKRGHFGSSRSQLGYVGQVFRGKGAEVVCSVASLVPEHDFHIVGATREELEILVGDSSLPGNLVFHGWVRPAKVPELLRDFDILLLPNQPQVWVSNGNLDIGRWTSPLKLFEYMAAGRPIICSSVEPLMEVARPRETMLVCSPDKPEDWAAAVRELASNLKLSDSLAQKALEDFMKNYTWESRAGKTLGFLGAPSNPVSRMPS